MAKKGSVRDLSGEINQRLRSLTGDVGPEMKVPWQTAKAGSNLPTAQNAGPFGPGNAMVPSFRSSWGPRTFNYAQNSNTDITPRAYDNISFEELKQIVTQCQLLEIAIETRKDEVERMRWNIVYEDDTNKAPTNEDARILAAEKLLKKPDNFYSWSQWIRQALDQMLTIDATTIWPMVSLGGDLLGLYLIDGASIKRIINIYGRTPQPDDVGYNGSGPIAAYQQIAKGQAFVNFSIDELYYLPHNPRVDHLYGHPPTEQIFQYASMFYDATMLKKDYYTKGAIPDAVLEMDAGIAPNQIDELLESWNLMAENTIGFKRQLRAIPFGCKIVQLKEAVLKDGFDEWMGKIIGNAFKMPTDWMTSKINKATAEQSATTAEDQGLKSILHWIEQWMTEIIQRFFGEDLVFRFKADTITDELKDSQINIGYVNAGIMSRDEVRGKLGLDAGAPGRTMVVGARLFVLDGVNPIAVALDPLGDANLIDQAATAEETQDSDELEN